MAEYGGKQRSQLSKVISRSESKDIQLQRFVDNRVQVNSQMNLIRSIQKKPNNTGLSDNLKSGIENLSGYSLDDVKVHYGLDKPTQLQALAYTQGTDIHIASGQEKHLSHEAWHVVQQMQGRVQPTVQMQGINIDDNEGLEKEADVMGKRAEINPIALHQNSNSQSLFINSLVQKRTIQLLAAFIDINGRIREGENGNVRRPAEHAERRLWNTQRNAIENSIVRQETIVNIGTRFGDMPPCDEHCRPYFRDNSNAQNEILGAFPDGVPHSMTFSLGTENAEHSRALVDPPLEYWIISAGDKPAPKESKKQKKELEKRMRYEKRGASRSKRLGRY